MERLAMATALGLGLLLSAGAADAQWRYTDDKGVSRVTQYKIDVPEPSRDAAEWIGPVGIGKTAPATKLESSGGLSLDTAAEYAGTGVDYLAVGALTHSVQVLDVGLDV